MSAHEPLPALSLGLPWAELVLFQRKRLVTQEGLPMLEGQPFRGTFLIHASAPEPGAYLRMSGTSAYRRARQAIDYPRPEGFGPGSILGIGEICWAGIQRGWDTTYRHDRQPVAIVQSAEDDTLDRYPVALDELDLGDFGEGRAIWAISWTIPLDRPVPCACAGDGLWVPSPDLLAQVRARSMGLL